MFSKKYFIGLKEYIEFERHLINFRKVANIPEDEMKKLWAKALSVAKNLGMVSTLVKKKYEKSTVTAPSLPKLDRV